MVLVGYWPLNEGSGDAKDFSSNENHGTLNGGITRTASGLHGQNAYSFDGSDDFVEVSDSPELSLEGRELTMSFWIRTSTSGRGGFIRKNPVNDWQPVYEAEVNRDGNGYLRFMNGDSTYEHTVSTITVNDGELHHIAATFNDSGSTARAFVDGELVDTWNWNAQNHDTGGNLQFGRMAQSNDSTTNETTAYYSGELSEIRLYNRPLTVSEIQYIYRTGKRGLHVTSRKSS
ncbi:LamG domain-containing protein [Candidatus Nanosalina sp. VS9-1]|uniref:LamG domain-containing protein n=1 Tax=Candidatus Nanosalina sp. VS9-1 TaxID=3388566 RepID=UPI0039E0F74D